MMVSVAAAKDARKAIITTRYPSGREKSYIDGERTTCIFNSFSFLCVSHACQHAAQTILDAMHTFKKNMHMNYCVHFRCEFLFEVLFFFPIQKASKGLVVSSVWFANTWHLITPTWRWLGGKFKADWLTNSTLFHNTLDWHDVKRHLVESSLMRNILPCSDDGIC